MVVNKTLHAIIWIIAVFTPTNATGILPRSTCPDSRRCGLFRWSKVQHVGEPGSESCIEYCKLFPSINRECGGCSDGVTLKTPSKSLPVPIAAPSLDLRKPVPKPAPVRLRAPIPVPKPVAVSVPIVNNYNILLDHVGVPVVDQALFKDATTRWQSIVVGDLSNISTSTLNAPLSGCAYPAVIDDLYICTTYRSIDGPYRVLGSSSAVYVRNSNRLTISGVMEFDSNDISYLKAQGNFGTVILHEIGHILGMYMKKCANLISISKKAHPVLSIFLR
jgi:hypothetical protein